MSDIQSNGLYFDVDVYKRVSTDIHVHARGAYFDRFAYQFCYQERKIDFSMDFLVPVGV